MAAESDKVSSGMLSAEESGEVVRALGAIFSNSFLYGPAHGQTIKAVKDAFAVLQVVFERGVDLAFSLADDELIVNGVTLELKNPLMKTFATHLADLEVNSFTITSDLKWEDFLKLVDLFNQKAADVIAAGGFPAGVRERGINGVATKSVVYQAVTEDEVVMNKDLAAQSGKGLDEGMSEAIISFLKGEEVQDEGALAKGLAEAADDAHKLSDLVVQAAEVRQKNEDQDFDSFASTVIDCLRKAYDVLCQDKSAQTQKGKKNLQKMLKLLERDILDKLKAVAGGADIDETFVSDAIEEMEDELKIDSLASDYMKKRNAIESNESKILRFIRAKGLEKIENTDLKERLFEGGLDVDGWRDLVARSGVNKGGGEGSEDGGMESVGHLAVLLHEMENSIASAGKGSVEGLDKVAIQVQKEIAGLVSKTEQKILSLVENMQNENEAESKGQPVPEAKRMPRKKLMEILAEIAQELCQPLAVINCSVDMIRGGSLGEVASTQLEMLCLAAESGARLETLINKLMKISGVPETRSPDADIQESLYK